VRDIGNANPPDRDRTVPFRGLPASFHQPIE